MADLIDLRSDTVTRPTKAMREAMAAADVGDDVYGEDPTVNRLQEKCAELAGKQAALFVPTGSMANQVSLGSITSAGDEVICGEGAHCFLYEGGAGPRINQIQFQLVGKGGAFTADDVRAAYKRDDHHYAPTTAIAVENTHNRGGGFVWKLDQIEAVTNAAHEHGMRSHLDGARIFNAQVASGVPVKTWAARFDTVSFCFSKGLGAPVGSIVCASMETIHKAHRLRKTFGGAMRQAGILAAAGLYALEHHVQRLAEDHANAKLFAERLANAKGFEIDPKTVETNIVIFGLGAGAPDAATFCAKAKEQGVLMNPVAARRVRAVTHLDVSKAQVEEAAKRLAGLIAKAA
ncbi:MAG TPA: low-specificity L-threonine aldolase [bacterium]|nr:low-specificity L-threonine aldolase [bacterium]